MATKESGTQYAGKEKADSAREGPSAFWDRANLESFFGAEATRLNEEYRDMRKIEDDRSLGAKEREKLLLELSQRSEGTFLLKLWSAIDYLLDESRRIREFEQQQPVQINPEFVEELRRLYLEVRESDKRHHRIADKVRLANDLRAFAGKAEIDMCSLSPEAVDEYAQENDNRALEELKHIKQEEPPFWVRRGEKFLPEVDTFKIPPFTARSILEDYRMIVKKREPEKR